MQKIVQKMGKLEKLSGQFFAICTALTSKYEDIKTKKTFKRQLFKRQLFKSSLNLQSKFKYFNFEI
jgi:hypothetical protein